MPTPPEFTGNHDRGIMFADEYAMLGVLMNTIDEALRWEDPASKEYEIPIGAVGKWALRNNDLLREEFVRVYRGIGWAKVVVIDEIVTLEREK